jgi:ligand-binding sensor domain-containing protein
VTQLRDISSQARDLAINTVDAAFEDAQGVLWIGTWGNGLVRVKLANG